MSRRIKYVKKTEYSISVPRQEAAKTTTTTTKKTVSTRRTRRTIEEPPVPIAPADTVVDEFLRDKVNNKVDTFFKCNDLVSSDDEDTDCLVKTEWNYCPKAHNIVWSDGSNGALNVVAGAANVSNQPTTSFQISGSSHSIPPKKKQRTDNIDDDILLLTDNILDNRNREEIPPRDIKSLEDYRRETEEMLRNASLLLDQIKGNRTVPTPPKTDEIKKPLESGSGSGLAMGTCPVCLESLAACPKSVTMCGHVFCKNCINHVVKTLKKCPTCRKALTKKKVHDLFL